MPKTKPTKSTDPDLAKMRDTFTWPQWPLLPLKHATQRDASGLRRLAVLIFTGGQDYRLAVDVNLFDSQTLSDGWNTWPVVTPESVLADGWIVD
jgi:hypothetical protein